MEGSTYDEIVDRVRQSRKAGALSWVDWNPEGSRGYQSG